jgi:hypothetical protein
MHKVDKIRQLSKFDNSFDKPRQRRSKKINYKSAILTISFYSVMPLLK